jgi:hypothetical protein
MQQRFHPFIYSGRRLAIREQLAATTAALNLQVIGFLSQCEQRILIVVSGTV